MLDRSEACEFQKDTLKESLEKVKVHLSAGKNVEAFAVFEYALECPLEEVNGELADLIEECCILVSEVATCELLEKAILRCDELYKYYKTIGLRDTLGYLLLRVGEMLLQLDEKEKAARYLRYIDVSTVYYLDALSLLGDMALKEGHKTRAKSRYQDLLERDPRCAHAYLRMLEICYEQDDMESCLHYLREAKRNVPSDPRWLEWAGKLRSKSPKNLSHKTTRSGEYQFRNARRGVPGRLNLPRERASQGRQYYVRTGWAFPKMDPGENN